MIRIQSFSTLKKNATNTNNSTTNTNTVTYASGVQGVRIWGQYHDHTSDVDGDMTNVGSISANGNIVTSGNIVGNQLQGTTVTSEHIVATDSNIGTMQGGTIHTTGNITTDANINAQSGYFDQHLVSEDIDSTVGNIGTLTSGNITCDNLTVTNAAHFFKLVVDIIKSSQGQIIITPANATIDLVEHNETDRYDLYFRAEDNNKKIHNMFEVGDQILCQTFNAAEGTSYDVDNKFYWAKCVFVSSSPVDKRINNKLQACHKIQLDWTDKAPLTNGIPEAGDEIVMLGNRTDTSRQSAISIGAYNNAYLDAGVQAPFMVQYSGINNYNLVSHRVNVISKGYNSFKGAFYTQTGDDIEDLINDVSVGTTAYVHTAYSNSADGQLNFSKSYFTNALYIGFCSNHTQTDTGLIYSDYTWCRLRGDNGDSASSFFLESNTLTIQLDENEESDQSDFYVYGYEITSNGKTQRNYNCDVSYVYPTSTYTQSMQLPVMISPTQEYQAFHQGLKLIRFEMYDVNDENVVAQMEIPIVRDGASGDDGNDSVQYTLLPIEEFAYVNAQGTVAIKLSYNILRIIGTNYELVTTTSNGYRIGFKAHNSISTSSTWYYLPYNTTSPTHINPNYASDWQTTPDHLEFLEVCLFDGNNEVIDRRIVYAQLMPMATFSITDEIKSTVMGHSTALSQLNQRVTTNTNSISTITQNYNQIQSTVNSHTTEIDNLTGRVTNSETNISNITQRADSIESTVQNLKTGAKNYFNFTKCVWTNAVPFIKGYGLEGKANSVRVSNLGFDGVGGDFSVSCMMRMANSAANVNVNICNVTDTENPTVSISTTWEYYTFKYEDVQNYIGNAADTNGYNGYIEFTSTSISNSNRLYVRNLMITRGTVPCDFYPSWKDTENANSDNIIKWNFAPIIAITGETYKGYQIYSPTSYSTREGEYTDYIFCNDQALKTNTPYTLSFYAKSEYPETIECYLYGNGGCVDGTIRNVVAAKNAGDVSMSNYSDGLTSCKIGTDWNFYIVHWYNQNAGNRSIIAYRDSADNWDEGDEPNIQICGFEFKEGYWDANQLNSQSMIRQTANELELSVNNISLRLDGISNEIELNGNTQINGSLTLNDSTQGFILTNGTNSTHISPQSIGSYNNFRSRVNNLINVKQNNTIELIEHTDYYESTLLYTYSLGTIPNNTLVTIKDYIANPFYANVSFKRRAITPIYYNALFKVLQGETEKAAVTITTSSVTNVCNITTTASEEVKVTVALTVRFNKALINSIYVNDEHILYNPTITGTIGYNLELPATSFMLIGHDGFAVNFGNNKTAYIGSDSTTIQYGNYGLRVSTTGLQKYSNDQWVNL